MGSLVGHVAPGFGFLVIGLWHLFNHIKLHAQRPNTYTAPIWFATPPLRHLELFLIMVGSSISIAMELFIGPVRHQPLDPDFTIPTNHLHNFEHSSISLTLLVYAALALLFDRVVRPVRAKYGLTLLLGAVAFGQELLMFHLHSTDHMGVEGQYHWLLQIVIGVSLATTLMGIGCPASFTVSFTRSASIFFQGLWLMFMGVMLWTPGLIAKGCFMNLEDGHYVVRCDGQASLDRAKSLANLQFSWFLVGISVFSVFFYLYLTGRFPELPEYASLAKDGDGDDDEDLESQKKLGDSGSFIQMGKGLIKSIDLER